MSFTSAFYLPFLALAVVADLRAAPRHATRAARAPGARMRRAERGAHLTTGTAPDSGARRSILSGGTAP